MTDTSVPSEQDLSSVDNLTEPLGPKDGNQITVTRSSDDIKSVTEEKSSHAQPIQEAQIRSKSPESNYSVSQIQNLNVVTPNAVPHISIEQQLQKSKRDLESMVLKYAKSERENLQNKIKVDELDKKLKRSIKDNDQLANRIKLLTNDKNHLTDTLNAKVAQLTVLEQKNSFLNNVQGAKLKELEEKTKKLESSNEDLLKQIESYKSKEGELLDFSERLSMKHMMLQSELDEALKKVPNYKEQYELTCQERDTLIQQGEELLNRINSLSESLKLEQEYSKSLKNEMELNEKKYQSSLDELQNEIKVMRRKHQIATKELFKEIKQLQAQIEKVELTTTTQNILRA